jgi:hypothetical protein
MTQLRRAPYKPGDIISGLINDGGACLTEGRVTSCHWLQRRDSWTVEAVMYLQPAIGDEGATRQAVYNDVNSKGESDYCSPGKSYPCRSQPRAEHQPGCPHSASGRVNLVKMTALAQSLGYRANERELSFHPMRTTLDQVAVTLTGHGVTFVMTFSWDVRKDVLKFHSGFKFDFGAEQVSGKADPETYRNAQRFIDQIELAALADMQAKESRMANDNRSIRQENDLCTCVEACDEDPATACGLAGQPHVHPASQGPGFGPCPVHPERPGDL